jgi:hypothetical protein
LGEQSDKRVTAELGNVGPFIVVPGPWSDKDVAYHAEHIVSTFIANAGFNCSTPRILIMDRNWDRRSEFLDRVRFLLREVPLRKAFYPGAERRYASFLKEHPDAEKIGVPEKDELPWTLITDLTSEKESDICFSTEPFCSIISETALLSDSVEDFILRSTRFANERMCGSLVATVIIHPKSLQDSSAAKAFDRLVANLKFGTIGINYWGGGSYVAGSTPWGAFQEANGAVSESGVGVVNNTFMLANTQKTVLRAPFKLRPKPVWFLSRRHNAAEAFRKLT